MRIFDKFKNNKSNSAPVFNKKDVIREILENKDEKCPGWKFFKISNDCAQKNLNMECINVPTMSGELIPIQYDTLQKLINGDIVPSPYGTNFDKILGDFLAIYTDVINKEIRSKGNPFSDYKTIVESEYQIVREIYITDGNIDADINSLSNNIYKRISVSSAKEFFIKLKNQV